MNLLWSVFNRIARKPGPVQPVIGKLPPMYLPAKRTDGFLVWNVNNGEGRGAAGVADSCEAIQQHLNAALRGMPDGPLEGFVRYARLALNTRHPSYVYGGCVVSIHRDADGVLVVRQG